MQKFWSYIIDVLSVTGGVLRYLEEIEPVLGLAFENLVVNNYRELLPRLHLGGALITSAAPYVRKKSKERDGNRLVEWATVVQ